MAEELKLMQKVYDMMEYAYSALPSIRNRKNLRFARI